MNRFGCVAMALMLALSLVAGGTGVVPDAALAAQKPVKKAAGKTAPKPTTDITADNLEIQDEKNLIIFTGNVRARRGATQLRADRLEVYTEKAGEGAQGDDGGETKMRRWIATGNVRIIKDGTVITGSRADMDVPRDVVTVTGNVVVKQRGSTIRGAKLIANLKTNITRIVAGGKRRVRGVFR